MWPFKSVTIQNKVIMLSSAFMWFIILCNVVLTFEFVDEILKRDHSNESYTEQYFPVVLFIMLYKVVLTFESVYKILKGDPSNKSYWAVLFRTTICYYKLVLIERILNKVTDV